MSTNVGKLTVHLGTDLRELLSGFQRATQRVEQFSRDVSRMGEKISQIGKGWSLAVTAPLAGFGALSLRSAGEFAKLLESLLDWPNNMLVRKKDNVLNVHLKLYLASYKQIKSRTTFRVTSLYQKFSERYKLQLQAL